MASTATESTSASSPPRENRPSKRTLSESTEQETQELKTESEPVSKKTKTTTATVTAADAGASATATVSGPSSSEVLSGRRILFVTGNKGKLAEVQRFLGKETGKHVMNEKINLLEIQGTAEEILKAKLKEAAEVVAKKVETERMDGILVEDTNLCLNAYGGMPGPYIKDFLDCGGRQGLIDMAKGKEDKSAMAVCLFGFIDLTSKPEPKMSVFRGQCAGQISSEIKGDSGFGWDPVFIPKEDGCDGRSFAEMTMDEKNKVSHRAKALDQLKPFIEQFIQQGQTDAAINISQAQAGVAGAPAVTAAADSSSNSNSSSNNSSNTSNQ